MNNIFILAILTGMLFISACSEQQIYNAGQGAREQECMKLPNTSDVRQCMEMADKEYGQYIKDRY